MKFPGDNKLTFTNNDIRELLKAHASAIFGDPDARITNIKTISYPEGLEVTFTTDPDPADAPVPRPSRTRALAEPALETPPSAPPRADDDQPF